MGRHKKTRQKRTAYLHAGLDEHNGIHVESQYLSSPEKTMATLIKTAEKWVSLTTSKAHSVGHSLKAHGQQPTNPLHNMAFVVPGSNGPSKVFSFLDSLPTEGPQDDDVLRLMCKDEKEFYLAQNSEARAELAAALRETRRLDGECVPLRFRLVRSRLPLDVKRRIVAKLDRQTESLTPGDSVKYNTWVELLLALPLGEVLVPQPSVPIAESMARAKRHLEATIYGHREAKSAILERFYLWLVSPFAVQRPLAICGVPGNGKTTLIREGLAAIMARPFAFVTLGGSMDSSSLLGHGYTYEGSTPGRIVEHLVSSRCVNPIFYFDELDKCSATPKGDEIINALIHFTDPQQSDKFRDRYVGNLDIDLSRALCVFSFNQASGISSILLDRLQVVHTDTFDCKAQAKIAATHLIPQVLKERGLAEDKVTLGSAALQHVASQCAEGGVRALRSVIEQAVTKVTLWSDAKDADMLAPLREKDIRQDEDGHWTVLSGLDRLLSERGKRDRPPSGMYIRVETMLARIESSNESPEIIPLTALDGPVPVHCRLSAEAGQHLCYCPLDVLWRVLQRERDFVAALQPDGRLGLVLDMALGVKLDHSRPPSPTVMAWVSLADSCALGERGSPCGDLHKRSPISLSTVYRLKALGKGVHSDGLPHITFDGRIAFAGQNDRRPIKGAMPNIFRSIGRVYCVGWVLLLAKSVIQNTTIGSPQVVEFVVNPAESISESDVPLKALSENAGPERPSRVLDDLGDRPMIDEAIKTLARTQAIMSRTVAQLNLTGKSKLLPHEPFAGQHLMKIPVFRLATPHGLTKHTQDKFHSGWQSSAEALTTSVGSGFMGIGVSVAKAVFNPVTGFAVFAALNVAAQAMGSMGRTSAAYLEGSALESWVYAWPQDPQQCLTQVLRAIKIGAREGIHDSNLQRTWAERSSCLGDTVALRSAIAGALRESFPKMGFTGRRWLELQDEKNKLMRLNTEGPLAFIRDDSALLATVQAILRPSDSGVWDKFKNEIGKTTQPLGLTATAALAKVSNDVLLSEYVQVLSEQRDHGQMLVQTFDDMLMRVTTMDFRQPHPNESGPLAMARTSGVVVCDAFASVISVHNELLRWTIEQNLFGATQTVMQTLIVISAVTTILSLFLSVWLLALEGGGLAALGKISELVVDACNTAIEQNDAVRTLVEEVEASGAELHKDMTYYLEHGVQISNRTEGQKAVNFCHSWIKYEGQKRILASWRIPSQVLKEFRTVLSHGELSADANILRRAAISSMKKMTQGLLITLGTLNATRARLSAFLRPRSDTDAEEDIKSIWHSLPGLAPAEEALGLWLYIQLLPIAVMSEPQIIEDAFAKHNEKVHRFLSALEEKSQAAQCHGETPAAAECSERIVQAVDIFQQHAGGSLKEVTPAQREHIPDVFEQMRKEYIHATQLCTRATMVENVAREVGSVISMSEKANFARALERFQDLADENPNDWRTMSHINQMAPSMRHMDAMARGTAPPWHGSVLDKSVLQLSPKYIQTKARELANGAENRFDVDAWMQSATGGDEAVVEHLARASDRSSPAVNSLRMRIAESSPGQQ